MKQISILSIVFVVFLGLPGVSVAAPDYSLTLRATELSSSEASTEVQLTAVVKRQSIRPRARKTRRKVLRLSVVFPSLSEPIALPRSCKVTASGSSLTQVECKLKKATGVRSRKMKFRISSTVACDTQVMISARVSKKGGRRPDSFAENDTDEVSFVRGCASTPGGPGNPENPTPPLAPGRDCTPLTSTQGTVYEVATVSALRQAVSAVNQSGGATILLEDGTYQLSQGLQITGSNIIVRSKSGDRSAVTLRGEGMSGGTTHVFWITGDDVTIADMTIGWVANHAVQIHGEQDADRTRLYNLQILDVREQFVKGSIGTPGAKRSNGGTVECSLFSFTSGGAIQNYTGGIDVHYGKNWTVRDNTFRNIKSPNSTWAEHAIHFWTDSEGTVVERNQIFNCDRGIGFGLGNRGHSGGIIRNNFIYHDDTPGDVGIGVENASNVKVYHNTIYFENGYPNAIEYRFAGTSADIRNNLSNEGIRERDGAAGTVVNNFTNAAASWFSDVSRGDLHLSAIGRAEVGDQVSLLTDVPDDYDGEERPSGAVDAGADEVE